MSIKGIQGFSKVWLTSITIAIMMCVGFSMQVMAQDPVVMKVVDANSNSTITPLDPENVEIYIELENVEAYYVQPVGDPPYDPEDIQGIKAIQFALTYNPNELEIKTDEDGVPDVVAYGKTALAGLEPWPVYANIVVDGAENPVGRLNIDLAMNPADESTFNPDWYGEPPAGGWNPPIPSPDTPWGNAAGIYALNESGLILKIGATCSCECTTDVGIAVLQDQNTGEDLAIFNENLEDEQGNPIGPEIPVNIVGGNVVCQQPTCSLEILEVKVSNLTSSSATISWKTRCADTKECAETSNNIVSYGADCGNLSDTASDSVNSDIHYVTITGLSPETQYFFKVSSDGTSYPEGAGNCLDFTTTKVGTGVAYILYGEVTGPDPDCETPVERALVFVQIGNSYPLSGLTDASGIWNLNLSNLKDSATNDVYAYATGDTVIIQAQGTCDTIGSPLNDVTVTGSSPQDTGTICTKPIPRCETRETSLLLGLNLVGLSLTPTDENCNEISFTSYTLLPEIPNGVAIIRYDPATQSSEQAFYIAPGLIIGTDFPIKVGEGYFIQVDSNTTWELTGMPIEDTSTYDFVLGLNLVSVPFPKDCFDSYSLLGGISCGVAIIRYNPATQSSEQAFYIAPGLIIGTQFSIADNEGYYVQASEACTYTPSCPATAPQISNRMFVPQVPRLASNPKIVGVTASNLSATATVISWHTNLPSDSVVYYGTSKAISSMKAKSRSYSQDHLVQLTGLQPNTTYYYHVRSGDTIDNAHGAYYTFTTADFGVGQMYPIYGQLVEADGKMPASGRVVYVTVQKGTESSIPLAAVTDARGYWNLNLADLKTNDGQVFDYQIGDEIHIQLPVSNFRYVGEVVGIPTQNLGRHLVPSRVSLANRVVPTKPMLHQNYPNPFNPETWIPYQLSQQEDVLITIYNSAGQIMKTLSLANQPAGLYLDKDKAAYWDGKNQVGESVASGIYFYTIRAGKFSATRKMILLK